MQKPHKIVIVGGGAGGLELAVKLGHKLGKNRQAIITLVDKNLTHLWKPLWHEAAAGTLTTSEDELNYSVLAYRNYFKFQLGNFIGIDKETKTIRLEAVADETDQEILPERVIAYDVLILAIGSISHDFNVPGVKDNCYFLDSYVNCQIFQREFLKKLLRLQERIDTEIRIAIVGGGATGVELAAELKFACKQALQYKNKEISELPNIHITLLESSPRILGALDEKIAQITHKELERQGIHILTNEQVVQVDKEKIYTKSGITISADLKVWAAGIKAPTILQQLGLKTNSRNQLIVKRTLQVTEDPSVFAFGDCADCPQENTKQSVPPRAQAAHQQAMLLAKSLPLFLQNKPPLLFHYHDYGSLISLSRLHAVGQLMGGRALGKIGLEGLLARTAYRFLYRKHQAVIFSWRRVFSLMLAEFLTRSLRPRLKLH